MKLITLGTRKQCWMSEVTGSGIYKVFLSKSVKEKFWDQQFLTYVTGCRKTQVSDCTSSTVQYINTKPFFPCQSYLIENQLIDLVVKGQGHSNFILIYNTPPCIYSWLSLSRTQLTRISGWVKFYRSSELRCV